MSFTHRSSQHFKDLLEALNVLSEEIEFTVNPEGLTAMQMNPNHEAMFVLKMPPTAFERWDIIEEQKFTVDITNLVKKILKNTYKDESVELSYDPNRMRLDVTLRSDMIRRKNVPTLENADEEVPLPKIFFKAHARVVLRSLVKALKDFSGLSEHTTITLENDSLTISQSGDSGSQSTPFEKYGDNLLDIRCEEDAKSTFTESYLEKVVKAIQPLSEVVNIDLSTDMPIKIWPELEVGTLEFYVAPCIGVGDEPEPVRVREAEEKEIAADETAYEEEVTGVPVPEELPQKPETEEPAPIPASVPEPAPIPMPITIDMSVLRRIRL